VREITCEAAFIDFDKERLFGLVKMPVQFLEHRDEIVHLTKECDRTICRGKVMLHVKFSWTMKTWLLREENQKRRLTEQHTARTSYRGHSTLATMYLSSVKSA